MALEINIGKIRSVVGSHLEEQLETQVFDFMSADWSLGVPLLAKVSVSHQGQFLELKALVKTTVVGKCDRCLAQVVIPVERSITEQLLYANDASRISHLGFGELEEKYFVYGNDTLDLADMIRESILADLPQKVLCQDDCRGLCPKCGQNLNHKQCDCQIREIDPRLAILAKLKATEEV